MRILHVIPSISPQRGGPSFMLPLLAEAQARLGLEVSIAATDDDGVGRLKVPLGKPERRGSVTYHFFARQSRFYSFSWTMFRWFQRSIANFDLVHIHSLFNFPVTAAAQVCQRCDVPYVIRPLGTLSVWGVRHRRPLLKKISMACLEEPLLSSAAAIQYTTAVEQEEAQSLGVTGKDVVVPNPILGPPDFKARGEFLRQFPQAKGRKIVLFLSRIDRKKGLDLLIPAMVKVIRGIPSALLVVAGSGDTALQAEMKEKAAVLGLSKALLWPGFLEGSMKWAAFLDSDIFVLPSYSENFGIAAAEAMACGLPIVVTDQVGIHRDVTDSDAGIVVQANVESVAEGITKLLRGPAGRGERGRQLVLEAYSAESVARRLQRLYQEILSRLSQVDRLANRPVAPVEQS